MVRRNAAAGVKLTDKMSSVQWGDETAVRSAIKDVRSDTTETNWYITICLSFLYRSLLHQGIDHI